MKSKPTGKQFAADPDNVELLELMTRLDGHGLTQREVAALLGISPGQLSRVKKGERHASRNHVRTLREHLRRLTLDRRDREMKSTPNPATHSIFAADVAVLKRLSPVAAVEAFRDLLWARATERGVSPARISITSEVFTADGGVDASILEGEGPLIDDDLLASGTRYQIKTGDFNLWQPAQVKEELFGRKNAVAFQNLGPAIRRTLCEQQRLVFVCFGVDPVDDKLRCALANLKSEFATCGYPNARVEIWGATQLASLFQRYPSICLQLRGHDHQGFRSWESWSSDAEMKSVVQYSPEFRRRVDELREGLRSGTVPHLRLIGEPGVGKTRMAMELTSVDDLKSVTLYVRDGRALLQSPFLNELIQPGERRFAILVIDECPPKDRSEIWNLLKSRSERVRVVTIDHGPEASADEGMLVFPVDPISDAQTKSIIAGYGIHDHDAQRWAAYCQGCPRVAHVIGENLRQNRNDILQVPATVEVWERFIVGTDGPESEEVQLRRIVLRHIALFERFGFEPPVDPEARFIASMAEKCDARLTWPRFQSVIARLKERRIVQGATTLYITPRLLHVHLNREFWGNHGSGFDIAGLWEDAPDQLRNWFVEMLWYAHTSPAASKAVDRLLGPGGIFAGGDFPDDPHYGQMMMMLSETNRLPALRCLQRTVGRASVANLRELRNARQQVVWSLGRLAVWEDCFCGSAELLLKLAEAENATHSNNATGTFVELFSLIPGMAATQVSAASRICFLRTVLDSDSAPRRAIAIRAAESALSTRGGTRIVGPEHQGLRLTIEFWAPKTYGELWDAYIAVWRMLAEKLDVWSGEERTSLLRALIRAARSVFGVQAVTPFVLDTLESLSDDAQLDVKELLTFVGHELRYGKEQLTEDSRGRLGAIKAKLEGNDFPSRLRRYVKYATTDDEYDDEHRRTNTLDSRLDELAREGMASRQLLLAELTWIQSEDSGSAFSLAYRIGKLDTTYDLLARLIDNQRDIGGGATSFLSGYLAAMHEGDPARWESVMLSLAERPVLREHFSDLAISSGMSDAVARRVVELCRAGVIDPRRLERLWFSQRLRQIDECILLQLIDLQLADGRTDLWANAVHMYHSYYIGVGDERAVPDQQTFRLLTWLIPEGESYESSARYYWSRLAAAFVARYPERIWEFFTAVLRIGTRHWSILSDLDTNRERVLTGIFEGDPRRAWECVAKVYADAEGRSRFGIQHWLADGGHRLHGDDAAGPIQAVPHGTLFAWVEQNVEDHGYWLIGALPKTMDRSPSGRLTREFLARYGANEEFSVELRHRFLSRAWCGQANDHYRALRTQAHEWLVGESNRLVIRWIEDYVDSLSAYIERAEIDEERRM